MSSDFERASRSLALYCHLASFISHSCHFLISLAFGFTHTRQVTGQQHKAGQGSLFGPAWCRYDMTATAALVATYLCGSLRTCSASRLSPLVSPLSPSLPSSSVHLSLCRLLARLLELQLASRAELCRLRVATFNLQHTHILGSLVLTRQHSSPCPSSAPCLFHTHFVAKSTPSFLFRLIGEILAPTPAPESEFLLCGRDCRPCLSLCASMSLDLFAVVGFF